MSIATPSRLAMLAAVLASPALAMFVSTNVVNVGNFAFNLIFSRLMTPAQFADLTFLLTVKLVILSALGALQMAVSRQAADGSLPIPVVARLILARPVWLLALMLAGITCLWLINLPLARGLAVLALACPLVLPLALLRGLALGRMDLRSTIASAQIEMIVRLVLSVAFWLFGWGMVGIGAALVLSLVLAWLPVRSMLGRMTAELAEAFSAPSSSRVWRGLALAAVPFAGLQIAQVLMLDGDVFIARSFLSGDQAGQLAALSLLQRVQFFACFGLAAVLIPTLVGALAKGHSLVSPLVQIALMFLSAAVPLISLSLFAPELMVGAVVGSAYLEAAPVAWLACVSAALLTLSYLMMTALITLGHSRIVWFALGIAAVQIGGQGLVAGFAEPTLTQMLSVKLACQVVLFGAVSLGLIVRKA